MKNPIQYSGVDVSSRLASGPTRFGRPTSLLAFTLVELLVVIAIIGILVALLLPAIQAAREAARRTGCQNNMKQLCLATINYESARKEFPPSKYEDYAGPKNLVEHTTMTYLLSYIEESQIADKWDWKRTWDDPTTLSINKSLSDTPIAAFRCATVPEHRPDYPGSPDYRVCDAMSTDSTKILIYKINKGEVKARPNSKGRYISLLWNQDSYTDTVYHPTGPAAKMKQCTDGTSQTFMWFETSANPLKYVKGVKQVNATTGQDTLLTSGRSWADYFNWYVVHGDISPGQCYDFLNCNNADEIYSFHVGGAYFGMGDGAVKWVGTDLDPDIFVSLMTRDSSDVLLQP